MRVDKIDANQITGMNLRDLDARVAERVMRRAVSRNVICVGEAGEVPDIAFTDSLSESVIPGRPTEIVSFEPVPHYSTRMADAWMVVEKFVEEGWEWSIAYEFPHGWRAALTTDAIDDWVDDTLPFGQARDAPLAICSAALEARRAALRAAGHGEET